MPEHTDTARLDLLECLLQRSNKEQICILHDRANTSRWHRYRFVGGSEAGIACWGTLRALLDAALEQREKTLAISQSKKWE
jgi:hypothetical protein